MKDFAGTPGTVTGLILRMLQCFFASGSIASMATTKSFFEFTAFWSWSVGQTAFGSLVLGIIELLVSIGLIAEFYFRKATLNQMNGKTGFPDLYYLIASMGLQVFWSFGLAFLDAYALAKKKIVHNPGLVGLFVVGDWVTATLSLAAASSSAGITVLYFSDLGGCRYGEECQKYQMAVGLAFLSWITIGISSVIMFWVLAAG